MSRRRHYAEYAEIRQYRQSCDARPENFRKMGTTDSDSVQPALQTGYKPNA